MVGRYGGGMLEPDFNREQELESAFGEERLQHFVSSHYLELMSYGAKSADRRIASEVRRLGRELQVPEVEMLLGMHWRPRVMGAWFAIAASDDTLSEAVHNSLETSLGHLTSPPLIVGVLTYPNERTLDLLLDYARADRDMGWGASGFAVAAAARLDGDLVNSRGELKSAGDHATRLEALLEFASKLRTS